MLLLFCLVGRHQWHLQPLEDAERCTYTGKLGRQTPAAARYCCVHLLTAVAPAKFRFLNLMPSSVDLNMIVFLALVCSLAFMNLSSGQFNFPTMEAGNNTAREFRAYQLIPRHTHDVEGVDAGSNLYSFGAARVDTHEARLDTPEAASYPVTQEQGVHEHPNDMNPYEIVDNYASILDTVKHGVVLEAILPLVTMAPLLVSAGLEADMDWTVPAAPKVSFPKLGQTHTVYMLKCFV
ncbi:conserved hypothetical protein [Neospora caninum Liverpool]|uniref:Uncharacterized protein n=1 Tax=Neospora caninum (strain Liverpool) TaxID=572307 RepID=F0VMP0_NEOCL|nr:conserved hypothetical protein [Neospora caninum Liverpool]CBZ54986.1 conserved hypothetical protein [Neospora caninum Liverpool]CEL69709.1 TPA: hypothetical protein BN1204_054130 [Neospora caninum Liverpool]|eukprot:XP_003885014.1 conserved hypothetical protein [Neospora caninum Liverpool]